MAFVCNTKALGVRHGLCTGSCCRGRTYNGENVIDPPVSDPKGDEAEKKGRDWDTKSHHDGPDTHELGAVLLEECLDNDTGANSCCWANEEGRDSSAEAHGCVGMAVGAADVADETANQRDQEDGSPAITLRQGPPEKRCNPEDGNHQRSEVTCCLDGDVQILCDVDEGCHDGSSSEGAHHGMEGHENKICDFLYSKRLR